MMSGTSGWIYFDSITLTPDSYVLMRIYNPSSRGRMDGQLKIELNVPSTITHYTVTEKQEEQGKAIGYNEVPILSSITLAGTLEDDTPFSYTLPTT